MDAKDLRTEGTLSERKDGSKYPQSGAAQQCNRNKTYQDIGTNPLGKAETAAAVRPCAVIGPDRVLPPPNSNDAYLKKSSIEPWPCPDNIYSQLPDYHHKMSSNPNQMRNISPRQTFQENMQRIMVPPAYNSIKNTTDGSTFNHVQDRAPVLSKNPKPNMASEAKYCDVPYTINQLSNEQKSFREPEISVPNVNSPLMRTIPHGWSPNSGNLHAPRAYGAHEVYQYQQYPNCVGPRPPMLPMGRRHQTFQEEAGYVYPDSYYQDPSIRFKSYPQLKERYPQPRFDYIGNYSNPYHPPPTFPPHKYDIPKPGTAHQYPLYQHLKYLENRGSDPSIDAYQRPSNQPPPGYNMPFRNQVIHPPYPGVGNAQTKVLPYSIDSSGKPIATNKLPYDSNKLYIDYDNVRNKSYAVNDPYFLSETNRIQPAKSQIIPPNYPTASMHHVPTQQFLRKDIHMKSHEFMPHFRNFDASVGSYTMIRHPSQFSPNTIAISPTDSNTSNDTTQTQGTNQEDCGYVSQSSSASVRSVESGINRMSSEYYRRYDYRYGPIGNTHMQSKHEVKGKKQIDVRQFLQMWNEGDDENGENNNKESIAQTNTSNVKQDNNQEQLYVLGLVNVPSEELSKYEHIQTVSKLPEHIKGYNSIELLKQYEEVVESSNMDSFKSPVSKNFHMPIRDNRSTPKQIVEVLPRPISPLDVEAKISQSVIHKEVGCNFEIKPCSPKMLNVEIPAPVQNVLGERVIEKVSNPLSKVTESSISVQTDDDSLHNNLKRQTSLPSYEKSSCKILSSSFAPHNLDSDKTDYSIQDLEINSGVCLASLPRLDNEIELNFPEVNQQFIDANKIDNTSKEKSKLKESDTVVELNSSKNENVSDSEDNEQKTTFSQYDSQKEFTRLNKYKKSNSTDHPDNPVTAVRTDSVIIKNPETLKSVGNSPRNDHSNFITEETHAPVNLTSHIDENNRSKTPADSPSDQDKTETYGAIDFSLNNKNNVTRPNKMSKKLKTRTSKPIVTEKNKLTTTNCFTVPSSDTKAHYKDNHFDKSNNKVDIQVTAIYKKESNSSSCLPTVTSEGIHNLNEYSGKPDFDDVMKNLTANDFEITNEINLESNNIITNSDKGISKNSKSYIDDQDFKSKCIHPTYNEQFVTSSQSKKHNNYEADILNDKEKLNQHSIQNKNLEMNELKVEEQIEAKQHKKDDKNSDKKNFKEEECCVISGHQPSKIESLDTDKLTEEHSTKVKQILDIGINDLSGENKNKPTEFETSDTSTLTEENRSAIPRLQQIENVNLKSDQLTEEGKEVKQIVEVENVGINSLYEKDDTKECNTFHLDMLIKNERNTILKQTQHEHFNIGKEEQKPKEIKIFNSNMTKVEQSIPLESQVQNLNLNMAKVEQSISLESQVNKSKILHSSTLSDATYEQHNTQEIMTLDAEAVSEGDQQITDIATDTIPEKEPKTIIEKHSQENINSDSGMLKKEEISEKLQQNLATVTTLEKTKTNIVNKNHELTPANSPLENDKKDLLFEIGHSTMQEQHLEEADNITENDKNERLVQTEVLTKNANLDAKMLVELQSVEINADDDQNVPQNKILQLSTKNFDWDTEMLAEYQSESSKIQREDNKSYETDVITKEGNKSFKIEALTEKDKSVSQNERPQKSTENSDFVTEMQVDQQIIETKILHGDNKSFKIETLPKDQNMSQNERPQLSTENSSFHTDMLVDQQSIKTKIQCEGNKNFKIDALDKENQGVSQILQSEDSSSINSVMSKREENLNPSHAIQRSCLENEHSLEDCISDNSFIENDSDCQLVNIPLPTSLPIDSNHSKKYISNCDEDVKNDMNCSFKPFKLIYRNNNSRFKIKLYSPQIQKLILHVEGFINFYDKSPEIILSDSNIEENEINEIVDEELGIDELQNNPKIAFEVKTGTEETDRENSDSGLLISLATDSEPVVDSVIKETNTSGVVNTPKSTQDNSLLDFDDFCDSTKSVIVEPDSNTNYSIIEDITSLTTKENLETSIANEQNTTVNTECEEINANESSLSFCDNTAATPHRGIEILQIIENIENNDCERADCTNTDSNEINTSDSKYMAKTENERNNTDVTFKQNNTTVVSTHDQNFAIPEIDEENVIYTFEKNVPEVRDSDQCNNSLKIRQTSLKRSLSDSALNAYAQENNRELSWPTKRRKIDENSLEQNIINESICRLIQASRRNSISSFDNEENVSFCILIDDTCILTEENAQDKICYAEVTESTESNTINEIEDNVMTGSPFPQNDIDLLTTDTVIYQCQEDDAVSEEPWVEDIACVETVNCENVEELVMSSSPSPNHGYNDTVISDNVAEDVVISSPSSIKYFEDDFVNVAPTFNHDWVETLVDDGVAEDVVISSFLTTKEHCLEGEICTNFEETVENSPSNLSNDWNETGHEDVGVNSILTHREGWDETLVNVANDNEDEVLITSPSQKYAIESKIKENIKRHNMDSSLTPKRSHSFERVVKVTDVMITDSPSSSKDHLEYIDNELSCYNLHEHANKVKSIYGERMTDGDAQIVDTLFRTPQMDVNKTLIHDPLELDISTKLSHMEYSDDSSPESPNRKSSSCIFSGYSDCKYNDSDIANRNTYQKNIVVEKPTSHSNACNESSDIKKSVSTECIPQDKTVHSCESSTDNVFTYEDSTYTSSSPEVSSTTSEERNSGILLKITNFNGSRISQINEIKSDRKPRCKFTEKKDYSSNRFPNRPLITKAAQKYIPPVKESICDLKVKISLPPQSLLKFKELKLSKNITKVTNKQSSTNIPKIPKKPKPLFEDVLKSIDEIQIKMHREKKKPKTSVPKVVIKKNEYGSHYASTPTKETFNPDLTGRKWQPWVFIERNNFIDKMALKNKTRAVFNHRKQCYVLAEKFKKYKSAVSNTKFVISRPSSIKSTGQLKYTIRLKHSY